MHKNMIEIERKFLVKKDLINNTNCLYTDIIQSYIKNNDKGCVRVRIEYPSWCNPSGYLMSKTYIEEFSSYETVDEISIKNAEIIIKNYGNNIIKKRRYLHQIGLNLWEVDYFSEPNELVIAEIELKSEYEKFELPVWIDKEVTNQKEYYNVNM